MSDTTSAGDGGGLVDDVRQSALNFYEWVTRNDFTDPRAIFICAEWHNLCHALGVPMKGAGHDYRAALRARSATP